MDKAEAQAGNAMLTQRAAGGNATMALLPVEQGSQSLSAPALMASSTTPCIIGGSSTPATLQVGGGSGGASAQPEVDAIGGAAGDNSSTGSCRASGHGKEIRDIRDIVEESIWENGLSPDTLQQMAEGEARTRPGLPQKTLFPEDLASAASLSSSREVPRALGGGGKQQLLAGVPGGIDSEESDGEFSLDVRTKGSTAAVPASATGGVPVGRVLPASIGGGAPNVAAGASYTSKAVAPGTGAGGSGAAPRVGALPAGALTPVRDERGSSIREERPSWRLWDLPDLKQEATKLAGKRAGLKFGPMPEDIIVRVSQRKKHELVGALVARADWRVELGLDPEWKSTAVGITPVKRREKEEKKIKKGLKAVGKTAAKESGKKSPLKPAQCFNARMVCLMLDEEMFGLYQRYKGGKGGLTRGEQDAGRMGKKHEFFVVLAKAMANPEWRNSDGNGISVPDDHVNDCRAPDGLMDQLQTLDLVGPAEALLIELRDSWKGQEEAFFMALQGRCEKTLKEIKTDFTNYQYNEHVSGGVGADTDDNGLAVDAIHSYQFMGAKLPTMLFKDLILKLSGGDDGGMAETINADTAKGSGSSIKGGPGVRSVAEKAGSGKERGAAAAAPAAEKGGKKKTKREAVAEEIRLKAMRLMTKMEQESDNNLKGDAPDVEGEEMARCEELAKVVDRLVGNVRDAKSEKSRNMYAKLLKKAEIRLEKAQEEMEMGDMNRQAEMEEAAEANTGKGRRTRESRGSSPSPFAWTARAVTYSPAAEAALAATSSGDSYVRAGASAGGGLPPS